MDMGMGTGIQHAMVTAWNTAEDGLGLSQWLLGPVSIVQCIGQAPSHSSNNQGQPGCMGHALECGQYL